MSKNNGNGDVFNTPFIKSFMQSMSDTINNIASSEEGINSMANFISTLAPGMNSQEIKEGLLEERESFERAKLNEHDFYLSEDLAKQQVMDDNTIIPYLKNSLKDGEKKIITRACLYGRQHLGVDFFEVKHEKIRIEKLVIDKDLTHVLESPVPDSEDLQSPKGKEELSDDDTAAESQDAIADRVLDEMMRAEEKAEWEKKSAEKTRKMQARIEKIAWDSIKKIFSDNPENATDANKEEQSDLVGDHTEADS